MRMRWEFHPPPVKAAGAAGSVLAFGSKVLGSFFGLNGWEAGYPKARSFTMFESVGPNRSSKWQGRASPVFGAPSLLTGGEIEVSLTL